MSIVEKLLVLQECDTRIRDMEKELQDIPARKEREQSRMAEHEVALSDAEEGLKIQQVEIKQFELENDGRRERIAKLRQQQLLLKTNQEFRAIETEVKGVEGEISGAEDQELVLMESLEAAKGDVEARKHDLIVERNAVAEDVKVLDERSVGIESELGKAHEERKSRTEGIDVEWMARYERVMSRKDVALVHLEDGICGGCHMKLPPSAAHDTKKGSLMVSCDYCGRLLY